MSKSNQKRDRTARLLRLQILLWQHPSGLDVEEIARKCRVGKRTAYRDLAVLESELDVPIWEEGSKRGIAEGYFLPPIAFTLAEAVNIYLAISKMQNISPLCNSSVASTFMKLNTIVPPILKNQVENILEHLEKLPKDERKMNNFERLIQAWLSRHPVTIQYQELYGEKPEERTVEPYFIEPSARNRANYVIGYCRLKKSICTFVIDRIIGDVRIEKDTYEIPNDFNIYNYLGFSWGAFADKEIETVKLRFSKRISKAIKETLFHRSQVTEMQGDGSLLMTLRVNNTGDFHAWIMSWGKDVEVLEPKELKNKMVDVIRSLADAYGIREISTNDRCEICPNLRTKSIEISDTQWKKIAPILPPQPHTGRHRANDRMIINGILCVLKSKSGWNAIPRKYGAYSTCYARYKAWKQMQVWTKIWEALSYSE